MSRVERTTIRAFDPAAPGEEVTREIADLPQDSLELSTTAKGEITFTAKVYGKDAAEIAERLASLVHIATAKTAEIKAQKAGTP